MNNSMKCLILREKNKVEKKINNNFKKLIEKYKKINNCENNDFNVIGGKFGIGFLIDYIENFILLNCEDCLFEEKDIILIEEYLEDNGYLLIS